MLPDKSDLLFHTPNVTLVIYIYISALDDEYLYFEAYLTVEKAPCWTLEALRHPTSTVLYAQRHRSVHCILMLIKMFSQKIIVFIYFATVMRGILVAND